MNTLSSSSEFCSIRCLQQIQKKRSRGDPAHRSSHPWKCSVWGLWTLSPAPQLPQQIPCAVCKPNHHPHAHHHIARSDGGRSYRRNRRGRSRVVNTRERRTIILLYLLIYGRSRVVNTRERRTIILLYIHPLYIIYFITKLNKTIFSVYKVVVV